MDATDANNFGPFLLPWISVEDSQLRLLTLELQREMSSQHPLFNFPIQVIARRIDTDDVLVEIGGKELAYADVHLTWNGQPDCHPDFPHSMPYRSLDEWKNHRMLPDHEEFRAS